MSPSKDPELALDQPVTTDDGHIQGDAIDEENKPTGTDDNDEGLPLQDDNTSACNLQDLPTEVLVMISGYVLTTDDGIIHITELRGHLRIAPCQSLPYADERSAFDGTLDLSATPKTFNQVQYVSKKFFQIACGLELALNHLDVSWWTFDTFRRLEQDTPAPAWFFSGPHLFANVRKVTLLGDFRVGRTADENILHGILRFAKAHAKATILVKIKDLSLTTQTLPGFMTLAWQIKQAVRGIRRPNWVAPKDKLIQSWRRGKRVEFMDVANVRFVPYDTYDNKVFRTAASKKKPAVGVTQAMKELGGVEELVKFVKDVYEQGL